MSPRPHALAIQDTRRYLAELRDRLPMFTITDHPTDYPDFFVARLALTLPAVEITAFAIMDADLDRLRETMEALGLVKLDRMPGDSPAVVECWL